MCDVYRMSTLPDDGPLRFLGFTGGITHRQKYVGYTMDNTAFTAAHEAALYAQLFSMRPNGVHVEKQMQVRSNLTLISIVSQDWVRGFLWFRCLV
jgi:hypothetical protein